MLLTGFDAPEEQVLHLDRFMKSHELLQAVFDDRGTTDISDTDACVDLLRDLRIRLGFINKAAANLYRDPQLNIVSAGNKVRQYSSRGFTR